MFLIGVDYSAQEGNVGLAGGRLNGDSLKIEFAECPGTRADVEKKIVSRINAEKKNGGGVLIAIDAPLGWPKSLSRALCRHKAGRAFSTPADQLFKRATDRWVRDKIKQKPLEIGADWIARTAYSALSFLLRLRNETGCAIPLAWNPKKLAEVSAIEVYPAATLKGRGFPSSTTESIIENLKEEATLRDGVDEQMRANEHIRDAVVCVLAAADFVKGEAVPPENMKLAKKEGWIWVKNLDEKPAVDLNEQAEALSAESGAANVSIHKTPGNRNRNGQITIRETQWPGNDHNAKICILECEKCKFRYGVNGSDIWERKCPNCQDGMPCSRPECPAVADGDIGDCRECRA